MSPTIITRDGQPFMAVGSPGGSTIPGTVLQVLLERLDLGSTAARRRSRGRARDQRNARHRAPPSRASSTRPRARPLARATATSYTSMSEIGAVTGIEFLSGGRTLAAAEPVRRGGGSAAVVEP